MNYHCSIYMVDAVECIEDKINFKPFKTASEMTKFTGLSVDGWLKRQAEAKKQKQKRQKGRVSNNSFLNDLVASLSI